MPPVANVEPSVMVSRVSTNLITRNNNSRFVIIVRFVVFGGLSLTRKTRLIIGVGIALELALSSFGDEDGDGAAPGEGFGAA